MLFSHPLCGVMFLLLGGVDLLHGERTHLLVFLLSGM
jgi:hypothetical protein